MKIEIPNSVKSDFEGYNFLINIFHQIKSLWFNDCYYNIFAEQKDIAIVTDDRDFWISDSNVKILTANKYLLKKQQSK